ncbi:hypothetical protein KIPB_010229 [Kipferlia bialata]|uniref:Uncharacterized protein n=1 Tax=Kipferlia bialata TaxID=797122 RepID=A0A9K3GMP5_9EUKA|nr:hypothetical protein KIPB_010229 [Kipferlia bialata]|eukprot:g10229.t1
MDKPSCIEELRSAFRDKRNIDNAFTKFVSTVEKNIAKPDYQDDFVLLFRDFPNLLQSVVTVTTATWDSLLTSLLAICNKNPSAISGAALQVLCELLTSEERLMRRFRPTQPVLMQMALPYYILGIGV